MAKQSHILARPRLSLFVPVAMTFLAASQNLYANAITDMDQALLAAIRIGAPAPPVAARDIAMVGILMFML